MLLGPAVYAFTVGGVMLHSARSTGWPIVARSVCG